MAERRSSSLGFLSQDSKLLTSLGISHSCLDNLETAFLIPRATLQNSSSLSHPKPCFFCYQKMTQPLISHMSVNSPIKVLFFPCLYLAFFSIISEKKTSFFLSCRHSHLCFITPCSMWCRTNCHGVWPGLES